MKRNIIESVPAAPLAVFRIVFGALLFIGTLRFWLKGWIFDLYIAPKFYFPYYGFEWIQSLGSLNYGLFFICGISALMVCLGWFYRTAIISLFLSFTYIELIDKTNYLNHYYFVSLLCFLLIFLPAASYFSIDSRKNENNSFSYVPAWCILSIKGFVALLYIYAGLAKINSDWLLEALPLKIWLPAHNDLPIIGPLLNHSWVHYAFSWIGCIYDLSIPFLLLYRRTRLFGFFLVVAFHVLTAILFPIGMFPYVMIGTALIFFSASFHEKILNTFFFFLGRPTTEKKLVFQKATNQGLSIVLAIFFTVQLLFPWRYLLYPGELFWTEEGYRFSWRVMLMEKAGFIQFRVIDSTGKSEFVNNSDYLTPLQIKMMATQPDMIVQFANFLAKEYQHRGFDQAQVYVESYVSLNGRRGKEFIDPKTDLAKEKDSFLHKTWIQPLNDKITGF